MREENGIIEIERAIDKLSRHHIRHIKVLKLGISRHHIIGVRPQNYYDPRNVLGNQPPQYFRLTNPTMF